MPQTPTDPADANDWLAELDHRFGPAAVMALDQRQLLPPAERMAGIDPETALDEDAATRIEGALLGALIGNALGAPARHLDRNEISMRFGRIRGYVHASPDATGTRGVPTSDGQLLMAWTEAVLEHGPDAAPVFADRMVALGSRLRGPGRATRHAIDQLANGTPWYAAGPASFGDAALLRSVADGARYPNRPRARALSSAVGTAVTHAHPHAIAGALLVADAIAAVITNPRALDNRQSFVATMMARCPDGDLVQALAEPLGGRQLRLSTRSPAEPTVTGALLNTFGWVFSDIDPVDCILRAVNAGGDTDIVVALIAALYGAAHGPELFPAEWREGLDDHDAVVELAHDVAVAMTSPPGPEKGPKRNGRRPTKAAPATAGDGASAPTHIWFLLDRSGSMNAVQEAVVDGFNEFLDEQRAKPGAARLTLVQFDGVDPFETVINGRPIQTVAPLSPAAFEPRGMTPLYDALGSLIDEAERHGRRLERRGEPAEDVLAVILTDGLENASRRWSSREIFDRVEQKKEHDGWTFVFLGANQDSYLSGGAIAMDRGNVSNFAFTDAGTRRAFRSVTRAASSYRDKPRSARLRDRKDFFEGRKEAEDGLK